MSVEQQWPSVLGQETEVGFSAKGVNLGWDSTQNSSQLSELEDRGVFENSLQVPQHSGLNPSGRFLDLSNDRSAGVASVVATTDTTATVTDYSPHTLSHMASMFSPLHTSLAPSAEKATHADSTPLIIESMSSPHSTTGIDNSSHTFSRALSAANDSDSDSSLLSLDPMSSLHYPLSALMTLALTDHCGSLERA